MTDYTKNGKQTINLCDMQVRCTKQKLAAIQLLGMARQSVGMYTPPAGSADQTAANIKAGMVQVLALATEYARTGADLTVLKVLEYPDTTRANQ